MLGRETDVAVIRCKCDIRLLLLAVRLLESLGSLHMGLLVAGIGGSTVEMKMPARKWRSVIQHRKCLTFRIPENSTRNLLVISTSINCSNSRNQNRGRRQRSANTTRESRGKQSSPSPQIAARSAEMASRMRKLSCFSRTDNSCRTPF